MEEDSLQDGPEGEPTGRLTGRKLRKYRQRQRRLYQRIREDLQLRGEIPTMPEGALRPETVDPAVQTEQPLPRLTERAIRKGWAVPEDRKADLVDELVRMVTDDEVSDKVRVQAFSALRQADRQQYEQDNPERVAKHKGTTVQVNVVQANVETARLIREMVANGELGLIEEPKVPTQPGASSAGGQQREVETRPAPETDQ